MKRYIIMSLCLIFYLAGCTQNSDSGLDANTIEKAISNNLEKEDKVFIIEKTKKGAVVLHETNPKSSNFQEVTAIDFFVGNEKEGWKYLDYYSSWTHYSNDNMTVYSELIPQEVVNQKGDNIVYGEINNRKIKEVQVKNNKGEYVFANIVSKDNKKIYYIIGKFNDFEVRGLSKDKEVIDQQG